VVILMQLAIAFGVWEFSDEALALRGAVTPDMTEIHNTQALGLLVYDRYILLFQLAGLILLVAMIGAIVLTLRHRVGIKRQNVLAQMYRDPGEGDGAEGREAGAGAVSGAGLDPADYGRH
jgi:NADH-quinone oxidoreductase subunit J